MPTALVVTDLWKSYRLYHERNQSLKPPIVGFAGLADFIDTPVKN